MPVPVQALPYSIPARSGRPGLVTAIAVLCIVIGCLSGWVSFTMGMEAVAFYVASKVSGMASPRSVVVSTGGAVPSPGSTFLPPGDTAVATNELTKQLSVSNAYVRELNKLMRSHGREILGVDEDTPVTAASIRAAITDVTPPGADGAPAHFATTAGQVDIYPDHAVFTSADGSATSETSAAKGTDATSQPSSPSSASSSTALTSTQINQAINAIQKSYGVKLNTKQTAAVRSALSASNQQLVTSSSGTPVLWANQQGNGNVTIQFDNGTLSMGPQGQVLFRSTTTFGAGAMGHIKGSTFAMAIGEAAGSLGLAIYIFVLGILLFRTSARMPRLLRVYALIKIPLAFLAGAALPLMFYEVTTTGIGSGTGFAPPTWLYLIWGGVIAVLGCAFPIGLLIALRARSLREYFNSVVA